MKHRLTALFKQAISAVAPDHTGIVIEIARPKHVQHGDYSCNVALQLAKPLQRNPRELAGALLKNLPQSSLISKAEIAGAGFINLFLSPEAKHAVVHEILSQGARYGCSTLGQGRRVQVEFVSANPTGPLHVGHGRGAAYGASLAELLKRAGYQVSREFYINDAGRQMDILALSTWLRYLEHAGSVIAFPNNAYQGGYVRDMAKKLAALHGKRFLGPVSGALTEPMPVDDDAESRLDEMIAAAKALLGEEYAYLHNFALSEQLEDTRGDLTEFGIHFDCWFSESSLHETGLVASAIERLQKAGHVYVQDGATWFRSTRFGDEKDRVVRRENGEYTYFASDIAYHLNKFERGFEHVIDVWGADHHGYVARVKGALSALGVDADRLTVALVQFAVLYRNGEKVPMSTRAGEFVTLRELRAEVGNDAARFFYVLRKSDQHLDFDLDLAKSQSNENPVYYVQYAHARICSVFAQWGGEVADLAAQADPSALTRPHELDLLQRLGDYPEVLEDAAYERAPHLIAYYLKELAASLHSYYNAEQFLVPEQRTKLARLALIAAVREVIRSGLSMLGVSCPEKM
ncbi:MAG: arginine--tRNA ligase [Burkholderiales bacterium]